MEQHQMKPIKISYGQTTRKILLDQTPSYESLIHLIVSRFQFSNDLPLCLAYVDGDGDVLSISSEIEWNEYLACTLESTTLRLQVQVIEHTSSARPEPPQLPSKEMSSASEESLFEDLGSSNSLSDDGSDAEDDGGKMAEDKGKGRAEDPEESPDSWSFLTSSQLGDTPVMSNCPPLIPMEPVSSNDNDDPPDQELPSASTSPHSKKNATPPSNTFVSSLLQSAFSQLSTAFAPSVELIPDSLDELMDREKTNKFIKSVADQFAAMVKSINVEARKMQEEFEKEMTSQQKDESEADETKEEENVVIDIPGAMPTTQPNVASASQRIDPITSLFSGSTQDQHGDSGEREVSSEEKRAAHYQQQLDDHVRETERKPFSCHMGSSSRVNEGTHQNSEFPAYRASDFDDNASTQPPSPPSCFLRTFAPLSSAAPRLSPGLGFGSFEPHQYRPPPSFVPAQSQSHHTNAMPGSYSYHYPGPSHNQERSRGSPPSLFNGLPQTLRDNITAGQRSTEMRRKLKELGFNPQDFGTSLVVERVIAARNEGEATEELVAKCVAQLV